MKTGGDIVGDRVKTIAGIFIEDDEPVIWASLSIFIGRMLQFAPLDERIRILTLLSAIALEDEKPEGKAN